MPGLNTRADDRRSRPAAIRPVLNRIVLGALPQALRFRTVRSRWRALPSQGLLVTRAELCETSHRPLRAATALEDGMKKVWTRPVVTEKPAGMEVTAYVSAKL
jgi:coenzyme PQQ precursor peptide PqqA